MKIISQQGVEADMKAFGIMEGGGKWAVIGQMANGPFGFGRSRKDYTLGVHGDKITAFSIMAKVVQHKGEEPFRMPPEDTVMDL